MTIQNPIQLAPVAASPAADRLALEAAIHEACARIAPLWPLRGFVAVNPFLGFTGQGFAATCATMRRVARVDMLMPRDFYRDALARGEIDDAALLAALRAAPAIPGAPTDVAALRAAASQERSWDQTLPGARHPAAVATVAEVLDSLSGGDREASRTRFMIDEISRWCGAYFDEGQASWRLPIRHLSPYAAWRATARHDRNPEAMGIAGFRAAILALPCDPVEAIGAVLAGLRIPERARADYLHRALFDIRGWAAYARHLGWVAAQQGREDGSLVGLLAIRIAWGYGLFQARSQDGRFRRAWTHAIATAASAPQDGQLGLDAELATDLLLHEAYEEAARRRLVARLSGHAASRPLRLPGRPAIQAAFCIDVRSEVFRRALETAMPGAETIGFAGFFGFPIEYVPFGRTRGAAHCPVLLKPAFTVCEAVQGATPAEEGGLHALRRLRQRAERAWKGFKRSAVSSFTHVETAGLLFGAKIASDSLGLTRTVAHPRDAALDAATAARLGPRIEAREEAGRLTGFDDAQRLAMAEAVLKGMSLASVGAGTTFARLVLLAGHGSTTVNNPHAAGLDCGACGGQTGEANARIAAAILNDPAVRTGLAGKGIQIPADTWFLPALHDTTTDAVTIFGEEAVPPGHATDLARLKDALARAGALARMERAVLLGLDASMDVDARITARSRDWSEVRPEWGLAGNAAFIAAPREVTRGLALGGRAFLHDYEAAQDDSGAVLELIMTAPLVVASWINLQYFGSTVNNDAFGSGNKVLHNVIGQLGVLEGNAGDLRAGLPWQSVHDGDRFVHEPLRLSVFIAAPEAAMEAVMAKHQGVRDLVENGWLHLHSLAEEGRVIRRRVPGGGWVEGAA
ncbi:YbcC family protein [Falsiroseomonas ponticola]|uniref:YbcC family protein n=1 Tax=Falsiroseomonas ponticola TaxID=2786951 RepID=UPI001933AC8E|nr:DUF2309 domain-containing protein [Roseomonas ponticola]